MLNLDLTNVAANNDFELLPEGTYNVILDDANIKTTKSGKGEYINAKFRVLGGKYDKRVLFHMFNLKNENSKAVEIGLQQLKSFMKASGQTTFKLESVLDLVGLRSGAVVKVRKDEQYGDKNVVSYFKASENVATAEATPF